MEISNKFGSVFVQSFKDKLEQTYGAVKEAVPIVGQVEEFYAGTEERANARLRARGITQKQIDESNRIIARVSKTGDATQRFIQYASDKTNIAPELIQAGAFAAEMMLDARMGGRMVFDTAKGAARMMPAEAAQALTLKDPANIPKGIKRGSAKAPEWEAQMIDFNRRRANIRERLQAARDRKSRNVGAYQDEAYNTVSTGPTRNPELNPEAYGSKKEFDKFKEQSEITPLTRQGNVKWQQQHHLFSKQESYQFVERMIELGDDDDVLSLFIMAEDMDAVMGGRLSNMLNMEDLPHSILHGSRITDKRQLQSAAMRNLVENAKSPDELMRMFREYITENVQPSKEEAKAFKIIGQRLLKAKKYGDLEQIRDKMYR